MGKNSEQNVGKPSLFELYITFVKIGAVMFGGGYAMLPLLRKELVQSKGWLTDEEIMDYYALGQFTPGTIAGTIATFAGYKDRKFLGSLVANAGIITPTLFIIILIAVFIGDFNSVPLIAKALKGINVVVTVMLVSSIIKIGLKSITDLWGLFIAIAAFVAVALLNISAIWIILGAALLGILIQWRKGAKG